ncbi:DUF6090 family protein [Winogradskyella sp. A3E31]|uniref:DUF6090 family protein n=1 Tax=Winogradskyella sp. A3E31 TaxID=3349637 RepID=UPI00398AF0CD
MIKFFRQIRYNLMEQNKTGRYLKYAIGEIILVVIGILIALQFNNWNTDMQTKEVQIKYLNEIANNLKADLKDVRFNIGFNETRLNASRIVLNSLDHNVTYSDSLDVYYGSLLYTTRSVVNYSAYETLKSKGLEIVTNDNLRKAITKLYSFYYQNVIDFETQDDHAMQYQIVMPTVLSRIEVRKKDNNAIAGEQLGKPINFETLKNDVEFKNAIVMNEDLRVYMLKNYRQLEQNILECTALINDELENLR